MLRHLTRHLSKLSSMRCHRHQLSQLSNNNHLHHLSSSLINKLISNMLLPPHPMHIMRWHTRLIKLHRHPCLNSRPRVAMETQRLFMVVVTKGTVLSMDKDTWPNVDITIMEVMDIRLELLMVSVAFNITSMEWKD